MLTSCPREGWIGETTRAGKGRLRGTFSVTDTNRLRHILVLFLHLFVKVVYKCPGINVRYIWQYLKGSDKTLTPGLLTPY